MAVNNVSGTSGSYSSYETKSVKGSAKSSSSSSSEAASKENAAPAAVYEKSDEAQKKAQAEASKKVKGPNTDVINQIKAANAQREQSFADMINKMFGQQAKTAGIAGIADDIWKRLASGDFTVDAATKKQAQEDISEDGYWGVKQTSSRILDFAVALAGNDPDKLEKMKSAFEKGYKQAEKTWGGKLPEISQKTYDAVLKGFEELKNPSVDA